MESPHLNFQNWKWSGIFKNIAKILMHVEKAQAVKGLMPQLVSGEILI